MKILLTNDDGIAAPGLRALRESVEAVGELVVVAPKDAASGASHRVTTGERFGVRQIEKNCFAVEGTPADCVRVALHRFGREIGWVLAGINNGGNLGVDVYHSGTVAAVREAVLRGVPGIAVSQYRDRVLDEEDWNRAVRWARPVLLDLLGRRWREHTFWNVNLPKPDGADDPPGVGYCRLDPSPLPLSYCDDGGRMRYNAAYHSRPRAEGADVHICFGGKITVTEVTVMESSR